MRSIMAENPDMPVLLAAHYFDLTKETEEKIVSRAFMVLLALIFIVTILDIIRFF